MKHIVIEKKEQCCACGACVSACARGAIQMKADEAGFMFPTVDEAQCVECGRCLDVCAFEQKGKGANGAPTVYAAVIRNKEVLAQSSSGGIFTALAEAVLEKGGTVFGAAWAEDFSLRHIAVQSEKDLCKLRGSKYVQSETGDTFRQVKELLKAGEYVCYSGTPCQIAGLKAYLGKEEEKLLTVDIICHGVPSLKMLHDDIDYVTGGNTAAVKDIRFRDKAYGWGVKGSLTTGEKKKKYHAGTSPYYFYFLKGEVYRASCYRCRFPAEGRQGDITLGDYWGIRGEVINKLNGAHPDRGISCVLVNNEKGKQWFENVQNGLVYTETTLAAVQKRNKQLVSASVPLPEHEALLGGYTKNGYAAFENGYKKHTKDHIVRGVKNMIPAGVKRKLNDLRR